jgi:hypothetical protein
MQMVWQNDDGFDVERMAPPNIAERLAQQIDVIDEKTQAALSQIGREEKAAAADKVSPIVCHRASIAQLKVMGFAALNPSYGLVIVYLGRGALRGSRILTTVHGRT